MLENDNASIAVGNTERSTFAAFDDASLPTIQVSVAPIRDSTNLRQLLALKAEPFPFWFWFLLSGHDASRVVYAHDFEVRIDELPSLPREHKASDCTFCLGTSGIRPFSKVFRATFVLVGSDQLLLKACTLRSTTTTVVFAAARFIRCVTVPSKCAWFHRSNRAHEVIDQRIQRRVARTLTSWKWLVAASVVWFRVVERDPRLDRHLLVRPPRLGHHNRVSHHPQGKRAQIRILRARHRPVKSYALGHVSSINEIDSSRTYRRRGVKGGIVVELPLDNRDVDGELISSTTHLARRMRDASSSDGDGHARDGSTSPKNSGWIVEVDELFERFPVWYGARNIRTTRVPIDLKKIKVTITRTRVSRYIEITRK